MRLTAELLALRTLQLERRDRDLEEIGLRVRRKREAGKEAFDDHHSIRKREVKEGDLVLLHNSARQKDMSRQAKMSFRWLGPYRVLSVNAVKGSYRLKELNGAPLQGSVAGNRIKKFFLRDTEANEDDTVIPVYDQPIEEESEGEGRETGLV